MVRVLENKPKTVTKTETKKEEAKKEETKKEEPKKEEPKKEEPKREEPKKSKANDNGKKLMMFTMFCIKRSCIAQNVAEID